MHGKRVIKALQKLLQINPMKIYKSLVGLGLALLLGACGGGGDSGGSVQPSGSSASVATLDDLTAAPGTAASTQGSTLCGFDVGAKHLQGLVSAVHDGDTVTLNAAGVIHKIRLDGIDAPELAQVFGSASHVALASAVLGQTVQVAYSQTDQYGRIIGAVFTAGCEYVSLKQVASGMAWFYRAYQCELSAPLRAQFAKAEEAALASRTGLWIDADPTAPWLYRNGVDPVAPACSSASSVWTGNPTPSAPATGSSASAGTAAPNSCFQIWVNPYTRSNGTHVNGYWRDSAGCT
jgi:endonuclease YncB( thermonuclease family)